MSRPLPDGLAVPDACPAIPTLAPPPPLPRAAWALAAVALVLRLAALIRDPVPPRDGVALAEAVRALAAGDAGPLVAAPFHPLAPLLAGPLAVLGADPVIALALVACVAGAAVTLPLFAVTRRLFDDPDAAAGAALLHAVSPPFVRLESTALSEGPFLLAAFLALGATLRTLRHFRPARVAFLAGLLGGAAWLARPEGVVAAALALAVTLPRGGGRPVGNRVRGLLAALAGVLLVMVPWWWARTAVDAGVGPFAGKSAAVLAGVAATPDLGGAATGEVRGPVGAALQALGALPEALHPALVAVVAAGLFALGRMPRCGRTLGAVAVPLGAAALYVAGLFLLEWRFGYGGRRHAAAAAAMLLPFAGPGFLLVARWTGSLARPLARPVAALAVVTGGLGLPLAAGAVLQHDASGREARDLGRALRAVPAARSAGGLRIATFGEPRVAWYAGGEDIRLRRAFGVPPGAPPAEAAARAAALRTWLRGPDAPDVVVLREDDPRVPPGLAPRDPAAAPLARAGRLRAWRAAEAFGD